MNIEIKEYLSLSLSELYSILQLRAEIFIVEQGLVYQDVDDNDQNALHLICKVNEKLIAYLRIRYIETKKIACIERVVVSKQYRKQKVGKAIIEAAISQISLNTYYKKICIDSRIESEKFYLKMGFSTKRKSKYEDIYFFEMEKDNCI